MVAGRTGLGGGLERTNPVRWWRVPSGAFRFVTSGALLMGAFYAFLYYPYGEDSLPARLLFQYLALLARIAGGLASLVDRSVSVQGVYILGRQPLHVVLDCAALDALALFAAAVLAFPARARAKLKGFIAGGAIIWSFNVLRIVLLYVAGMKSPRLFDVLHEDVMALLLVLVSVACFVAWAARLCNHPTRGVAHASSGV
jgi:exosortase/archaeosortase family protein